MKNKWFIGSYKKNEVKRLETNLLNLNFVFYLPKIIININSKSKEEILFPGYIFIQTSLDNYSTLKYTKGVKKIIKFGNYIPYMSNEDIEAIKMLEEESKINPVSQQIEIGKDVLIAKGAFSGNIVKICSLPTRERIEVLISLFGSMRRVTVPIKNLTF